MSQQWTHLTPRSSAATAAAAAAAAGLSSAAVPSASPPSATDDSQQQQQQQPPQSPPFAPHPPTSTSTGGGNSSGLGNARRRAGHSRHTSAFHAAAATFVPAASPSAAPSPSPLSTPHAAAVSSSASAATASPAAAAAPHPGGILQSHMLPPAPAPAAAAAPVPPSQESLPYHRKRLLELVDPATYASCIADTARQLGLDLSRPASQGGQAHKRWVVEAMFLTPLPQGWVRCYDAKGRPYYFDHNTRASQWRHPCAQQFEALLQAQVPPPAGGSASSAAVAPAVEPVARSSQQPQESKTNDVAAGNDAGPRHSRTFLRSNAGLSSTSSLFLTEEELRAWDGDGAQEAQLERQERLQQQQQQLQRLKQKHRLASAEAEARGARRRQQRRQLRDRRSGALDETLLLDGQRDGERWAGEDDTPTGSSSSSGSGSSNSEYDKAASDDGGDDDDRSSVVFGQRQDQPALPLPRSRASSSYSRTSRGALRAAHRRPASSSSSHHRQPSWSTAQPPVFQPWVSAGGVGDTEVIVPNQGSLIAPPPPLHHHSAATMLAPFRPPRPATAVAAGRAASHKQQQRPSSSRSVTLGASSSSFASTGAAARAHVSSLIRDSHVRTRASINGSLQSKASEMFSLRQRLLTKMRAVERWVGDNTAAAAAAGTPQPTSPASGAGSSPATTAVAASAGAGASSELRAWAETQSSTRELASTTSQRLALFRLALPMLEEADARALGRMLARTEAECAAALARQRDGVAQVHAAREQAQHLLHQMQVQADATAERLRVDAACLEMARSGVSADDVTAGNNTAAAGPNTGAPTSLALLSDLLSRVELFQAGLRALHSEGGARRASERSLVSDLAKVNALLLRKGFQHACERRAQVQAQALAQRALIPSLTSKIKALQHDLQAQMQPLAVCQRTYEVRKASLSSSRGSAQQPHYDPSNSFSAGGAAVADDESAVLLSRLEDELAALSTLVSHLESEKVLVSSELAEAMEQDRLRQAEASAEEVRSKFYKNMLAVTHVATAAQGHSAAKQQFPPQQQLMMQHNQFAGSWHPHGHMHPPPHPHVPHVYPPDAASFSHVHAHPHPHPHPAHSPAVGTYLASFQPDERTPIVSATDGHGQTAPTLSWDARATATARSRPVSSTAAAKQTVHRPSSSSKHGVSALRPASARPASAALSASQGPSVPAPPPPPGSSEAAHWRAQLVRDQASNLERLRTRKVRRAKVAAGAAAKSEMLIPSAGRPVFEFVHSTGYDS